MARIKQMLPALVLIAALIAAWWGAVIATHSVIFPTPWAVITGTFELLEDGTLSRHIGASLLRVGAGFGLAVCVAVPLGLWMGWVDRVYRTLNPIFQILRPISPIAWIPIANIVLMLNIAKKPIWWIILFFIPIVSLVMAIIVWMAVAEARGKPNWWGILLIVPVVGLAVPGYLAWAD